MKVVVAPDSFKGNLSAVQVAEYIEAGIKMADSNIEVKKIPIADGGEGTVEALVIATDGKIINKNVNGPLMEEIEGFYGVLGDSETAVIEMAAAAGLNLVKDELKNPMNTTTYGVGQLILAAIDRGCKRIILGIGGSATNDAGVGMAQALGVKFYNKEGVLIGTGGKYLNDIESIDISEMDKRLANIEIIVACDVKNPLYGENGAAYVYASQKGASQEDLKHLDAGLKNFAQKVKNSLAVDISEIPGSGAAGGMGGGLIAFLGAVLRPGIEVIMKYCNFEGHVKGADLLITGEGKTDRQTAYGKVPVGVATAAKKYNVPVVCISGGLGNGYEEIYNYGIDAAFSNINDAMDLKTAMAKSGEMMTQSAYAIMRLIMKVKKMT